jgi:LAO/AO transport system kinase
MLETLLERFHHHDRLALARLVSLVARGEQVEEILAGVGEPARPARAVAITGSGGVGKSTLVGKLIEQIRGHGQSVAVLACDPQSPLSGGALLGDRFRMPARPDDDGVFIRSLAAAGGHGALAEHLAALIRLLETFGFEVVLVETVGAGQGDTAVREQVDVLVLLLQPETGDDLQWEKAGLLEVADVIALHKADLPGAERVEAQVLAALALGTPNGETPAPSIPVLRVSSRSGEGVKELWQTIASRPLRRGRQQSGRDLLRLAQQTLAARFAAAEAKGQIEFRQLLAAWQRGEISSTQAASDLVRLLAIPGI